MNSVMDEIDANRELLGLSESAKRAIEQMVVSEVSIALNTMGNTLACISQRLQHEILSQSLLVRPEEDESST